MGGTCSTINPEVKQSKQSAKARKTSTAKSTARSATSASNAAMGPSSQPSLSKRTSAATEADNPLVTRARSGDVNQQRAAADPREAGNSASRSPAPRTADRLHAASSSASCSTPAVPKCVCPPTVNSGAALDDTTTPAPRRVSDSHDLSSSFPNEQVAFTEPPHPELTAHSVRRVRASGAPRHGRLTVELHAKDFFSTTTPTAGLAPRNPPQKEIPSRPSVSSRCRSWIDSIDCGLELGALLDPNDVAGQEKRQTSWKLITNASAK